MNEMTRERARKLMQQVMKTWNPPATGFGRPADVAQTAVMQTIAFVMGRDFLPNNMTANQTAAIDEGLKLMDQVL